MSQFLTVMISVLAVGFLVWLMIPTSSASNNVIDPNDSRIIGQLVGMYGGSIEDAAIARFALERFQQTHGRPATFQDMAIVVGIMQTIE